MTNKPLAFNSKLHIALIQLPLVEEIFGVALFKSLRNLGLPDTAIYAAIPPLNMDLASANYAEVFALLGKYADLFSAGPHEICLVGKQGDEQHKTKKYSSLKDLSR